MNDYDDMFSYNSTQKRTTRALRLTPGGPGTEYFVARNNNVTFDPIKLMKTIKRQHQRHSYSDSHLIVKEL